jgi:hypothetical protein
VELCAPTAAGGIQRDVLLFVDVKHALSDTSEVCCGMHLVKLLAHPKIVGRWLWKLRGHRESDFAQNGIMLETQQQRLGRHPLLPGNVYLKSNIESYLGQRLKINGRTLVCCEQLS